MIKEEINVFRGFMEIEERSIHTIRQYLDILTWFESFLQEKNIDFQELSENDIVKFQLWIRNKHLVNQFMRIYKKPPTKIELEVFSKTTKKLGGKSLYKYLTTIKKFLEVNDKQLNWTRIPSPKYDENFNPEVLSPSDIQKIAQTASRYCTFQHSTISSDDCIKCNKYRMPKSYKSAAQRSYPKVCFYFDGLKLKSMILLAYEAALRTDELCNLKLGHLDLDQKEIFIEKPLKHSQPQAVPISDNLNSLLRDYLKNYKYLNNEEDILFPTKTGKKYHANNFATHVFRPIAKLAGFDVRYYTLRHSRATNLIKQGLDIGWVRRITRHKNINNVLKYIHLSSHDIRKELEKKDLL
ncbi:MAG: tyrosine-type recombinase/integrase [Candidatus Heimdallarchaeota archaeon]|nr:tyrosine-type recombinase/integrase [Candidatus Heimdallarchaeota archaeon]MBY8995132.1 tyrosine-type recombinase/integrase [Candidatus Heimdallarchaeota archaeon]